jgi:hypothetical protein
MGPSLGIQVEIQSGSNAKQMVPGPGQYEPYIAEKLLTLDKIRHSSMFSRTNLVSSPLILPNLSLSTHLSLTSRTVSLWLPGRHHTVPSSPLQRSFLEHTLTPLDTRTHVQDRFGQPVEKKSEHFVVPGPGTYAQAHRVHKTQASTSSFVSASERNFGDPPVKGQPGPAYYNPMLPAKKSFHLNANSRWL